MRWTEAEMTQLSKVWRPDLPQTAQAAAVAKEFAGRSADSILKKARMMGLKRSAVEGRPWTDEERQLLRDRWDTRRPRNAQARALAPLFDGRSAGAVARQASVIGLRSGAPPATITGPAPPLRNAEPAKAASIPPAVVLPGSRAVPLADLSAHECRYPVSTTTPHRFCGLPATPGAPYCAKHRQVTTRPVEDV